MATRSLRSRLIFGSLMWTVGSLAIATAFATLVVAHQPQWAAVAHNVMLSIFAFACVVAGLSQLRRGLSPFKQLRERLSEVRAGRQPRVDGEYPSEVQPLVDELNALLEEREQRVARALAKAGDLAHGLKTPLAVLSQEATRADAAGLRDLAQTIGHEVERMRRQVEYHLVHARAAASGATTGSRCAVLEPVQALTRTMLRLHHDRGLTFDIQVSPDHAIRGQREDLDEMLGNLLDNACKWATARVSVASSLQDGFIVITVDDDGRGLEASMRTTVLARGVRADQAAPGSGFGLAIVRDLADLYGGTIVLGGAPTRGLRATLRLPAATS